MGDLANITAARDQTFIDRLRLTCRPLLLPIFCLAQLLDAVNLSGANVALPRIQEDLGFSVGTLQWVISAYALTFGGFLMLTGKLGDLYGHRKFFILGLVWFTLFAVIAGLSTSSTMMVVARGLQGIGAASTIPNAIALILRIYPMGRARNQAMSLFSSVGAIGFVVGLIVGGAVTQSSLGWRWIFYISAIISGCMAIMAAIVVPTKMPNDEEDATTATSGRSVDYLGGLLSTSAMLLLVFVLTDANTRGWQSPLIISLLIVAIVLLAVFVWVESKLKEPLMPPSIWKLPNFASAFVIACCVMAYFQGFLYFVTLIFQDVFKYDALETAVRYLPTGIVAAIMGISSERIVHHMNIKVALIAGLSLGTVGNILLGFYQEEDQYWRFLFPAFIIGVMGLSSCYASVCIAAISAAPSNMAGIVGGLLNTGFQIGGGLGLAITTAVATSVNKPGTTGHDLMKGYHAGLWAATGIIVFALIIAIAFVRNVSVSGSTTTDMHEVVVLDESPKSVDSLSVEEKEVRAGSEEFGKVDSEETLKGA